MLFERKMLPQSLRHAYVVTKKFSDKAEFVPQQAHKLLDFVNPQSPSLFFFLAKPRII